MGVDGEVRLGVLDGGGWVPSGTLSRPGFFLLAVSKLEVVRELLCFVSFFFLLAPNPRAFFNSNHDSKLD